MLKLSPSKLSVFKDCPRCFWLQERCKIKRPRGAFPTLPGGMDRVAKAWLEAFRPGSALPPELAAQLPAGLGLYPDTQQLQTWQNWRKGLVAVLEINGVEVQFQGALDDLLIETEAADPGHAPFDVKSKGSQPKDDGAQYYQHQLDSYGLLLEANQRRLTGSAYLGYIWPESMVGQMVHFGIQVCTLSCEPARAVALLGEAVAVLAGGIPESAAGCEWCGYARDYRQAVALLEEQGDEAPVAAGEPAE